MNWDWLFGNKEEPAEEEEHYYCSADPLDPVVFQGTTAELLASLPPPKEMAEPAVEEPTTPLGEIRVSEDQIDKLKLIVNNVSSNGQEEIMEVEKEGTTMMYESDPTWTNIELLKMAIEIEASKKQKMIFYVDVGQMPKKAIESYLTELKKTHKDKDGDFWLPRKEGGRGTEVSTAPGRITLEGVLETAQKLKEFVAAK